MIDMVYVSQGNYNYKSIGFFDVGKVLYTSDLNPCVAVLIKDLKLQLCTMIHSPDLNGFSTVIERIIKKMWIPTIETAHYEVGLIGGHNAFSLLGRKQILSQILGSVAIKLEIPDPINKSAYLTWNGYMFNSKIDLMFHLQTSMKQPSKSS